MQPSYRLLRHGAALPSIVVKKHYYINPFRRDGGVFYQWARSPIFGQAADFLGKSP